MSTCNWSDRYTTEQMEYIISNLLDIIAEEYIQDYNNGFISKEGIVKKFSNFGFAIADINTFFWWADED